MLVLYGHHITLLKGGQCLGVFIEQLLLLGIPLDQGQLPSLSGECPLLPWSVMDREALQVVSEWAAKNNFAW